MSRYRMHTASGSVYSIDTTAKTWERVGRVPIIGTDATSGRLTRTPKVVIGERVRLEDADVGPIVTTTCMRLESLDDPGDA
jgi:hypothetical protein